MNLNFEKEYKENCSTISDINEHLPTLKILATQSNSIAELGVRSIVSTYAFLNGLCDRKEEENGKREKCLWMNDINAANIEAIQNKALLSNVKVHFETGNDLKVNLPPEGFDLTFIDTWHVYGQLKRELSRYAPITKKFIAMHDTTVDAEWGETIRLGWNAENQAISSGFSVSEIKKGLWPAVKEFLENNEDWILLRRYQNNNGLTVLVRRKYIAIGNILP